MSALPFLKGSRIILLYSIAARGGFPASTINGGTKAMLEHFAHFAKVWSKELVSSCFKSLSCN